MNKISQQNGVVIVGGALAVYLLYKSAGALVNIAVIVVGVFLAEYMIAKAGIKVS